MAKHIFLVDGNSIAHANHNANVLTVGEMQVQAIFGFLKSMRAMLNANPGSKEVLVLWDGKAQWRIDLYPEYKGNRKPLDAKQAAHKEAFQRQVPFIEKALKLLGIRQMRSPLLEADDLAGHLVPQLVAKGHEVTLVSGDRDWIQLVRPGVEWFDPIRDRRVTTDNFLDFTGYFNVEAYVQGKALQGDDSDNVEGIVGMGQTTSQLFLATWKDVNAFFAAVDSGAHIPKARKSKTATSLHPEQILSSPEGRAIFERNMKLMDLRQARKPEPGELIITNVMPDIAGFELLCQRLAFASILREFNSFLRAFNLAPATVPA